MVLRWAAAALLETGKNFRKIMGYRDLWMLKTALDPNTVSAKQEVATLSRDFSAWAIRSSSCLPLSHKVIGDYFRGRSEDGWTFNSSRGRNKPTPQFVVTLWRGE